MIVIFKVIVNYDIIYDIIFVGQKYDIGQKYDNIRPNLYPLARAKHEFTHNVCTQLLLLSWGASSPSS